MDQNFPPETQVSLQDASVNQTLSAQTQFPWKYLSFALIIFILVGIGVFLMGRNTNTQTQSNAQITPTSSTTSPYPTKWQRNFLTIKNQHGYSIMHDSDLKITSQGMGNYVDASYEDAITLIDQRVFRSNQLYPFMQIVVFEAKQSHYNVSSLSEIAAANLKENSENPNIPTEITDPLHETTFKDKKAFTFAFKCKGFSGIYESMLGVDGTCRMIFTENKGKFFFIGYYMTQEFEQIISTFTFEN